MQSNKASRRLRTKCRSARGNFGSRLTNHSIEIGQGYAFDAVKAA
jgi:hypothetical protein